jgi:hypothetical protein
MKVNVKWGKETFADIEVDLGQPPLMFKTQLFTLSGVPPERQKIMIKGGLLKDDDWGKQQPKDSQTLMMMGSADPIAVEPPQNVPTFVEDLPEAKQAALANRHFGSGLSNLGNTCYMNATVQCLFSVEALRSAVASYAGPSTDPTGRLVEATKELFADMAKGGEPFPPYKFLMLLRQRYPQFAQTGNQGMPMQQDAEECFTQLMYSLREKVKVRGAGGARGARRRSGSGGGGGGGVLAHAHVCRPPAGLGAAARRQGPRPAPRRRRRALPPQDGEDSAVEKLFGVKLHTKLTCEESKESFEVRGQLGPRRLGRSCSHAAAQLGRSSAEPRSEHLLARSAAARPLPSSPARSPAHPHAHSPPHPHAPPPRALRRRALATCSSATSAATSTTCTRAWRWA